MLTVENLRRFPVPAPVQEYVDLGDTLTLNQGLPPDAEAAIRARRLEIVGTFQPQHLNVLGDIAQARLDSLLQRPRPGHRRDAHH
jgi:hypothetical protein